MFLIFEAETPPRKQLFGMKKTDRSSIFLGKLAKLIGNIVSINSRQCCTSAGKSAGKHPCTFPLVKVFTYAKRRNLYRRNSLLILKTLKTKAEYINRYSLLRWTAVSAIEASSAPFSDSSTLGNKLFKQKQVTSALSNFNKRYIMT